MSALHELYLTVKAEVAEAVAAVNAATAAATEIAYEEIQDALEALMALDDYLNFFGLVGDPLENFVTQIAQLLTQLAFYLDSRGMYAMNRQYYKAQQQYWAAWNGYQGFVGGMGGKSGGSGASGSWGESLPPKKYPFYSCYNRGAAILHQLNTDVPPPESAIDSSIIIGPCSEVFIYECQQPTSLWDNGIYQYIRWHAWIVFTDRDVIFDGDWGEEPLYTDPTIGYDYIIENRSETFDVKHVQPQNDWGAAGPIATWPDSANSLISTKEGIVNRDVQLSVKGQYQWGDHLYWLYQQSYWQAYQSYGFYSSGGEPIPAGSPEQVKFSNPCEETPISGREIKPWAPWFIAPILFDEKKKTKLAKTLRLGCDLRPYEIMINGEKLTINEEQLTIGKDE